jgi:hypothetical protein
MKLVGALLVALLAASCVAAPAAGDHEALWTTKDVSRYLANTPTGTLDQWASRGEGPPYSRIGRRRLYVPSEVREWARSRRVTAA